MLQRALESGISYKEYWEYTVDEIILMLQTFSKIEERRHSNNYELASLIAGFVGASFSGKDIPTFTEIFPHYASEAEQQAENNEMDYQQMAFMCERFKVFADIHNQIRMEATENGPRETSS